MSEFRVEIVRLGVVYAHPNADLLEITNVFGDGSPNSGYPCIVQKGQYKADDLVVFISVDSDVQASDPRFSFLVPAPKRKADMTDTQWAAREEKYRKELEGRVRVRAKKIRGIYSEGLVIPLDEKLLAKIAYPFVSNVAGPMPGMDVSSHLNIIKWEPDLANRNPQKWGGHIDNGENEPDTGALPVYTDVDGYRRYSGVFEEGEEVVLLEKIDGCLPFDGKVLMADNTFKAISKVCVGDEVLGMINGRVTATRVTQTFNNGRAETWLKIKGDRKGAGRGNHFFAITCTPQHKFWLDDRQEYVQAADLRPGDAVSMIRAEYDLTPIQKQILAAKMAGDGSYRNQTHGIAAGIEWGHKKEHLEYTRWTARALGSIVLPHEGEFISGYGTDMVRMHTTQTGRLNEFLSMFIRDASNEEREQGRRYIKTIRESVDVFFTPISLAFLYMDQGSLSHHVDQEDRACFALSDLTEGDCGVIQSALRRYGVESVYYTSTNSEREKEYSCLRLNADDADKFFLLIAPYVPTCMQYKLPERYRGHAGWLPSDRAAEYKPMIVQQTITSIEDVTKEERSLRYDIETDAHNYFAHGILVHNSNMRAVYSEGRLIVGSHYCIKRKPCDPTPWQLRLHSIKMLWWKTLVKLSDLSLIKTPRRPRRPGVLMNTFWEAAIAYGLEEKLKTHPDVIVFGEVYGPTQSNRSPYGTPNKVAFAAYDAMDGRTRRYLDYDEFTVLMDMLGIPRVPELYRGLWKTELTSLADGKSTLSLDTIREGFIMKPVHEHYNERIGRKILKLKSEAFCLKE